MSDLRRSAKSSRPRPALPLAPRGLAGVLLFSPHPQRLVAFYRDVLGLPLQPVKLRGFPAHHGCELSSVYLAILRGESRPGARSCLAFHVDDAVGASRELAAAGVPRLGPPRRTQLGLIGRFRDPDGNLFELYQP